VCASTAETCSPPFSEGTESALRCSRSVIPLPQARPSFCYRPRPLTLLNFPSPLVSLPAIKFSCLVERLHFLFSILGNFPSSSLTFFPPQSFPFPHFTTGTFPHLGSPGTSFLSPGPTPPSISDLWKAELTPSFVFFNLSLYFPPPPPPGGLLSKTFSRNSKFLFPSS